MRKALELDRRKGGLGYEKEQTEKRENKREQSHGPFLLLYFIRGAQRPPVVAPAPPPLDANQSLAPPRFQARSENCALAARCASQARICSIL
jgi:hypothetical protein